MTNRMTGITGLIDTDSLVTATMKPYKLKVDTQKQKLQTLEWQQEQYRTIMKDSKSFYDKYLDPLGPKSLARSSKYTTTKYESDKENVVTATTSNGAAVDTYTVNVTQLAAKATTSLSLPAGSEAKTISIDDGSGGTIDINFTASSDGAATVKSYNDAVTAMKTALASDPDKLAALNDNTITATYSEFTNSVTFTASEMGDGGFELNGTPIEDKKLNATITNSNGDVYQITDADNITTNSKTIDGVTYNFKGEGIATLTGGTDITDFKENITSFVNDYNTLLSSINTKIYETYNKSYQPLTDEQREAMTDDQIEKWEKKSQTGLLRKDSYLQDLAADMKEAMSTFMSSTGLSLEEIGIKPVEDYTDKNGLLTIDEDKLTNALETNFDEVKDLFIKGIADDDTTNGGVITKLKDAIYSGTISSTAALVEQAGKDTGVSTLTNEMTEQITAMKTRIKGMEDALIDRENVLYTKYASLESALSQLQAQQSSLSSYFS